MVLENRDHTFIDCFSKHSARREEIGLWEEKVRPYFLLYYAHEI